MLRKAVAPGPVEAQVTLARVVSYSAREASVQRVIALPDGSTVLLGQFEEINFDPSDRRLAQGDPPTVIAHLDPSGALRWRKIKGDACLYTGGGFASPSGALTLLLEYCEQDYMGATLDHYGSQAIVRLSPDGALISQTLIDATGAAGFGTSQRITAIQPGNDGSILLAGIGAGDVKIGGATFPVEAVGGAEGETFFLMKLTPEESVAWTRTWTETYRESAGASLVAIATDPNGRSYAIGTYVEELRLDDGINLVAPLEARQYIEDIQRGFVADCYVFRFGEDGAREVMLRFGGYYSQSCDGLVVDDNGDITILGRFEREADLGEGVVSTEFSTGFLAKYVAR